MDTTTGCDTCFDTETIDHGGREVDCPDCVAHYHPSSVTVMEHPLGGFKAFDRSQDPNGVWYGARCDNRHEAATYARKRQGVIKAALTRRSNKRRLS